MWAVLLLYGGLQLNRLIVYGETLITSSVKDSYYNMEIVFPDDIEDKLFDNFNIAFGLTAYDGDEEPIDDLKYGRIFTRY